MLVGGDQTSFLYIRGINENFLYAVDLLNFGNELKTQTILVKLDLKKKCSTLLLCLLSSTPYKFEASHHIGSNGSRAHF